MSLSTIIVNHEVRPVGSFSDTGMGKMLAYYSREDEFREIGGCDRSTTRDDAELERIRAINTYADLVDYGSRQGKYAARNTERPLVEGERSGTCFGQHGVIDPEALKRELAESGSHLVTSVVSVRREDAARLRLATKDDFQRLLRKEWSHQCEQWGVIEPQDIRWAAWFHTDNEVSLHVHVVTWDRSGRFSKPGALVPKDQIWSSQEGLRREALKDSIAELNHERSFLRDWIAYRVKVDMGHPRDEGREARLSEQAHHWRGSDADFELRRTVSRVEREKIAAKVIAEMPKDAVKSYSYARSSEEVRKASLDAVQELRRADTHLDAAFVRYEKIVREVAEGIGLRSDVERVGDSFRNPAEEYFKDAVFDLNRRAAGALLKQCSPVDLRIIHRDRELTSMRHPEGHGLAGAYADRFVELCGEGASAPLSPQQVKSLREHAESVFAKTADRLARSNIEPVARNGIEREARSEHDNAYRALDFAAALSAIFAEHPHERERDSHEGAFRSKRHREERSHGRDEHGR